MEKRNFSRRVGSFRDFCRWNASWRTVKCFTPAKRSTGNDGKRGKMGKGEGKFWGKIGRIFRKRDFGRSQRPVENSAPYNGHSIGFQRFPAAVENFGESVKNRPVWNNPALLWKKRGRKSGLNESFFALFFRYRTEKKRFLPRLCNGAAGDQCRTEAFFLPSVTPLAQER